MLLPRASSGSYFNVTVQSKMSNVFVQMNTEKLYKLINHFCHIKHKQRLPAAKVATMSKTNGRSEKLRGGWHTHGGHVLVPSRAGSNLPVEKVMIYLLKKHLPFKRAASFEASSSGTPKNRAA